MNKRTYISALLMMLCMSITPQTIKVCALVKVASGNDEAIVEAGGRVVTWINDIAIAELPINKLHELRLNPDILRIEAKQGRSITLDTMAIVTNATDVYAGMQLPQAFRGAGTVMGVMDVGFDLTHPNFKNADGKGLRIKRFWDQIAEREEGSELVVGREFTNESDILNYACSRDSEITWHGSHTLGIAAGNGAGTPFVGMAPESDICIVSNAVTNDTAYIATDDRCLYTYATDVLGFKYIFDYADEVGKPCVISFSEGSPQDFHGDDLLFYEALEALTGPGHILVASAGNGGSENGYLKKEADDEMAGTFLKKWASDMYLTMTASAPINLRFQTYGSYQGLYEFSIAPLFEDGCDSMEETFTVGPDTYTVRIEGYASCYNPDVMAFSIVIHGQKGVGMKHSLSLEMVGKGAEAELFKDNGEFYTSTLNPLLATSTSDYSINSPSSAPCVICVGATSWRRGWTDEEGTYHLNDWGGNGQRSNYSSIGPTYDGRIKPDVMAPGTNIISSTNSYYIEGLGGTDPNVVHSFVSNGRKYGFASQGGTSMSSPTVGGIIALWLEACPTLSPQDVMNVIAKTSKPIDDTLPRPNNTEGYGVIDAYAGLLEVLNLNGIPEIQAHQPTGVSFSLTASKCLNVSFKVPLRETQTLSLYATTGKFVKSLVIPMGTESYEIDLSSLPKGVYAVAIKGNNEGADGSTLIRI